MGFTRTKFATFRRRIREGGERAPATFTLRNLLLFGVGLAVLCGLRQFDVAVFVFVYAVIYYGLLGIGTALTRQRKSEFESPFPRLEPSDRSTLPALVTVATCTLSAYFAWHTIIVMTDMLVIGGALPLYWLQQCTLALLHGALLLTYFGNCWNARRVDLNGCRTTAIFSFLLTISHLAQPWFVNWLVALYWRLGVYQLPEVPE